MLCMQILIFFLGGTTAGLVAGLLGVGGGVILVPALFFTMHLLNFDPENIMYFSTSTALASMLLTTLASFLLHKQKQGIEWILIKRMLLGLIMGVLLAIYPGHHFSGILLQTLFGCFLVFNGAQCIFAFLPKKNKTSDSYQLPSFLDASFFSLIIGFFSVLLGVAGGLFVGQYFTYKRLDMRKSISTASAASFIITLSASLFYIIFNREFSDASHFGKLFFGPIYLPAFATLSVSSMIAAFFGVKLVYAIDVIKIKKIFGGFCILMGIVMIGKTFF